ncbi:ectoine/hydroxyectoine ABC transporter substrate-binding protein EhuB [Streptomyces armeniacus]|uniref:Ectoine/hydroxyectoine ABC transporter substrate-binding protein EhuB n=1 Tax=Streptomyces armeniacus TaxID=83291 RepID=A0A345XXW5_9ACTN|nr:ectoine/hydroxyectoine ABC transporter substrate-binding protein EhuB [Streptomyces armeniacus]AXK36481.1 ectoine/hydroxyectoine ABC transporter substrate-binding protein EhuB [Streptomyces armeniacus]
MGTGAAVAAAAGVTAYQLNGGGTSGGSGGLLQQLRDKGTVRLGIANEKPFGYLDGGRPTGAGPEVAKEIFKRLGVPRAKAVTLDFTALVPGLKSGNCDVIAASMNVHPDRCEQVLFSDADFRIKDAFLVPRGNPRGVATYGNVAGKKLKLAVANGEAQLEHAKSAGVRDVATVPDVAAGLNAVAQGRFDAFATTRLIAAQIAAGEDSSLEVTKPFQPIGDGKRVRNASAFAFRLGEEELQKAFNDELRKLKKSGEFLRLVRPFGFTEADMTVLTAEEIC